MRNISAKKTGPLDKIRRVSVCKITLNLRNGQQKWLTEILWGNRSYRTAPDKIYENIYGSARERIGRHLSSCRPNTTLFTILFHPESRTLSHQLWFLTRQIAGLLTSYEGKLQYTALSHMDEAQRRKMAGAGPNAHFSLFHICVCFVSAGMFGPQLDAVIFWVDHRLE